MYTLLVQTDREGGKRERERETGGGGESERERERKRERDKEKEQQIDIHLWSISEDRPGKQKVVMERMTSSEMGKSAPLVEALILPGSTLFRW